MWLYRWLLYLLPGTLRRDYGAAMEEMLFRRLRDGADGSAWRLLRLWCRELVGLLVLAVSERVDLTARAHRRQRQLMSAPKAGLMDIITQEIRQGVRRLARTPVFTLASATTLALAIAANVTIFAVVYRVVINPLPYAQPDRLIALDYGMPSRNLPSGLTSMAWQLYFQLADRAHTLEHVAVYSAQAGTLNDGSGKPERLQIVRATPSLASVLRVAPALGRWFTEDEGVTGASAVTVLSHGLWVRRFGEDPAVLNHVITLDGVPTTVIGVMPADFSFPDARVEMWTAAQSTRANASFLFTQTGVARLRDGVTIEQTRTEMTKLINDLSRVVTNQRGLTSMAVPLQDAIVGRIAGVLWILLGAVGLVLLVACANVANLVLVRSETRQREVAVRRALGASHRGVARFFFTESALIAVTGGAVGLALAWVATHLLVDYGPTMLPRLDEVRLDEVSFAFAGGLALIATAIFGLIPLLRLPPLGLTLHENTRGSAPSHGSHRARQVLMGGQVALALILLLASALLVRSFQKLRAVELGFDARSSLTFSIGLPATKYPNRDAAVALHRQILDRLSTIPGVSGAAASTCLPLSGGCYGNAVRVEGEAPDPNRPRPFVWFRGVSTGYPEVMGMRVHRGRVLTGDEIERGAPAVVINRAFADAYFPGQDPIDRRIRSSSLPNTTPAPAWLRIVGVVSNTPTLALAETAPGPQMFMPMSIAGGPDIPRDALIGPDVTDMRYVIRASVPPSDLVSATRDAITQVDPALAIAQVRTLQDIVDRASDQASFTMVLVAIAAIVALLLGAIGIYAVVSYIVTQRTGEIGVRLAMGAEPGRVARMVLQQSGVVTLAGIVVGLIAALAGTRLIQSLLYGVNPRDPVVFAVTTAFLIAVAFIACWVPARRAARLSPLDALRAD